MADDLGGFIGGHGGALKPLGITFIGKDGRVARRNASDEDRRMGEEYLAENFGVYAVT